MQWVVLKMLPFDNKSEFQLVVDMPAGTPLEDTAAALHEMAGFLARQPEVLDMQGYAGTASPITFNGLVRQYYLRADAEQGDLQVNLVDKAHRHEQSHAIAQRLRPELEKIAAAPRRAAEGGGSAARPAGDEPAGGRGLRPRRSRPPAAGRARGAGLRRHARHHRASTPRCTPTRRAPSCACSGSAPNRWASRWPAVAATVQGALSGTDAAWLHDGQSKYPVPVRLQLPREAQVGLDALLALPLRAGQRPAGAAVRTGARGARRHRQAAVHQGPAWA